MTKQPNDSYLRDITDSSLLVVEYVKGFSFEEFEKDTMRFLAVSRLLEIIGEATNRRFDILRRRDLCRSLKKRQRLGSR